MNRSILIYAGLLVVSLGASYMHYTADEVAPKEGVMVIEARKDDLQSVVYEAPDLKVTLEMREDAVGRYPWITVDETKKKKVDGVETTERKQSRFKGGAAADKLIQSSVPLVAVRRLDNVDDERVASFGLKTPDTKVSYTIGGRTTVFELGGETYGTRDRYVRDVSTGLLYVLDDELFKPLKFANSRLPERSLISPKPEEIDSVTVAQGGTVVSWTQRNKEDKDARYWNRDTPVAEAPAPAEGAAAPAAGGKDETFSNWVDKLLKLKSTAYVQEGDTPTDPQLRFEFTVRVKGKPDETVQVLQAEDAWYARSNYTRGLVKLARTSAEDLADEVDDILAGRAPPEKPKPAPRTPPTKKDAQAAGEAPTTAPPGMPKPPQPVEPRPRPEAGSK